MVIALTRPIFSDRWPNVSPPAMAPRLATMVIQTDGRGVEMVLLLQEGRIEVLRAVAEQIEAHHQHDHVDRQAPILIQRLPEAGFGVRLRCDEGGRFGHAGADEQHHQGGQDAEQEHRAPADGVAAERMAEEQAIGDRGENEAARIAALQDAGHEPARLRRDRLHRQRAAEAPFAAHRHAEQRPQHQEDPEARSEGGERADDRKAEDVEHQRRPASPNVADPAENEGADEPHGERQEQGVGDRRDVDPELLGDVLEKKGQEEEIERVEHPAEKRGQDRSLLRRGQIHWRPPDSQTLRPQCCFFLDPTRIPGAGDPLCLIEFPRTAIGARPPQWPRARPAALILDSAAARF